MPTAYADPETDSEDELPPGWEERATFDGDVYYANHNTKSTQWTHPRTGKKKRVPTALPFGWDREVLPDGKVLYVNHDTKKTTFSDPRLAFAVEEPKDERSPLDDFRQRFDASSRAVQVLHGHDLSGQLAVVTGANSGIGFEVARTLALHECTVVFACRDLAKAEAAIESIRRERPRVKCLAMELDLASFESVRRFAKEFYEKCQGLDILVLNAGVFGVKHELTVDGLESMFQVNYLSHFYLAQLLRSRMPAHAGAKIVVLSAESHRFASIDSVDHLSPQLLAKKSKREFVSMFAYNDSKLMCLMFALELDRRWGPTFGIRAIAVHPGNMVSSRLSRNWWFYRVLFAVVRPFSKSLQQAASSPVFAAAAPEMRNVGGIYVNNCFPCEPSEFAQDPKAAAVLWESSLEILKDKVEAIGIQM